MTSPGRHRVRRTRSPGDRTLLPLAGATALVTCAGLLATGHLPWPGEGTVTTTAVAEVAAPGAVAGEVTAARTAAAGSLSVVPLPAPPPLVADRALAVRPVQLRIPAIGVRSRLEELSTAQDGTLQPPVDADLAGWFAAGPAPGDLGPAVVAGHVDSRTGPGVFWRLSELTAGDRVVVERQAGDEVAFRVVSVRQVDKDRFPTQLVYGPTPERGLRLITCGGTYDRGEGGYRDNIVVFAVMI